MLHLTARTVHGRPLHDPQVARKLWGALSKAFPEAMACCLMGNHLHLAVEGESGRAQRALRAILGRTKGDWEPVPAAKVVPDKRDKVLRELRYIHLNPCRAGLAKDPLAWPWSTHRDVLGAITEPWVSARRLDHLIEAEAFHRYVSADPSVAIDGTPVPRISVARYQHPLAEIALAALSSTRSESADLRRRRLARRVFLQLAREQGWTSSEQLSALCEVTPRAVQKAWAAAPIYGAARLCLHDERLRRVR